MTALLRESEVAMSSLRNPLRFVIFGCLFLICLLTPVVAAAILAVGPETPKGRLLLFGLVVALFGLSILLDHLERTTFRRAR